MTETAMQPFARWIESINQPICGVLTDIDDTLTTESEITPDALGAMASLRNAGIHVIPITGRPIGWCEPFINGDSDSVHEPWPVDAMVAENGAVAFIPATPLATRVAWRANNDAGSALSKIYQQDSVTRTIQFARMQKIVAQIEEEVPGARRATDSAGRECDIAIDHSEFTTLPQSAIDQCVAIMRAAGMNATVSSIHINGWFGDHNKLEGARWIVRMLFGRDLDAEIDQWIYVGDSTNDQLMFQHFPHSVGVANIARFVPQLEHLPRYITQGERGAGFAEVASAVLRHISKR